MPSFPVTIYDANGGAITSTNPQPAKDFYSYSGDVLNVAFTADRMKATTVTLSTSPTTILTGSPRYFITGMTVFFDPASSRTPPASLLVSIQDTIDGILCTWVTYFPVIAPVPTIVTTIPIPLAFFYKATTNGSSLQVVGNGSPTAGNLYVNVNYGFTSL